MNDHLIAEVKPDTATAEALREAEREVEVGNERRPLDRMLELLLDRAVADAPIVARAHASAGS